MNDYDGLSRPAQLPRILEATRKVGFLKTSDLLAGNLLGTLAATKPGGRLLEIGTGTGIATAWLLDGMDDAASLASVDRDSRVQAVAREILGNDRRVRFFTGEAKAFLESEPAESFDLIFADGQGTQIHRSRSGAVTLAARCVLHRRQYVHAPVSSAGTGRRAARIPQRS